MRTFLVLVLSITALAAAGLWAYSRERTIDVTYPAVTTTNQLWPIERLSKAIGFSSDTYRIVAVRGSIHFMLQGFRLAPDQTCIEANRTLTCFMEMPEGVPQYSYGGRLMSIDALLVPCNVVACWHSGLIDPLSGGGTNTPIEPMQASGNSVHVHVRGRLWLMFLLAAAYPVWTLWRRPARIRSRRTRRGLCGVCGYNLHSNTSGVCPECGQATPLTATA